MIKGQMGGRTPKGKQKQEAILPERIPRELADFLRRATYSLLIKGSSGTGKTILALSILRALKVTKGFLYVSTRTSPVELLQSYTWIGETFDLGPLLESSSSGGAAGRLASPRGARLGGTEPRLSGATQRAEARAGSPLAR